MSQTSTPQPLKADRRRLPPIDFDHRTDMPLTLTQRNARVQESEPGGDPLDQAARIVDHAFHGIIAEASFGVSPMAIGSAYADWALHLALSPGKQLQLLGKATRKLARFSAIAASSALSPHAPDSIEPLPQDQRFKAEEWRSWPFHLVSQGFLLQQQWWHNAMTGVSGVTKQHENVVDFTTRQILDMWSPSNFVFSNPVVLRQTVETKGANLVNGFLNLIEDWSRFQRNTKPVGADAFKLGRDVAATPGKVVYRNRLIELIQFAPMTNKVRPEPILFVPAWIMKYYILDLSPGNSLVRYLVAEGYTVFMISWRNPTEQDRDLGMEDYRELGIMSAFDAVSAICSQHKIHAVGYCLGGTLLSVAAAAMARDDDDRLQSLTLFAAQVDFTEAGELTLFINESQVTFLEELMRSQGYLGGGQMAGAFQLLRSNDLIWSKAVHEYLMGKRDPMNDLMAWNADATRLPYRMHSQYLRRLFLDNDLAEGRYEAGGRAVALTDIRAPIFALGTETDHVAPWRSAFKIGLLTDAEVTFVLTSGGHNAGVVSEPGHKGRHYRIRTTGAMDSYLDPDSWFAQTAPQEGSWWPQWAAWLAARSGEAAEPPGFNEVKVLCGAPGTYVFQR
jgi:polyhydroxyalkanoate synthase